MLRLKLFKIFLLIFVLFLMAGESFGQQSLLSKKVTYSYSGLQLGTVLRKLQNQTGVKFSYNPELIPTGKSISMQGINQPLGEVLKQLLGDPGISFKEIGDQLVLYRGDPATVVDVPKPTAIEKPSLKKVPDTVYMHHTDTLVVNKTDTVYRTINTIRIDTVVIRDTVFIEKYRTQKPGRKLKNLFNNSLKQQKFLENNGLYVGAFTEILPGNAKYSSISNESDTYASLMSQVNTSALAKFTVGIIAGYDYYKVGVRSGIGYTRLSENFDYSFTKESGGFFKTDTVERYYQLHGSDTTFFYITRSSWIPKETENFSYKNPNTYQYIDIPFTVKYRFWQNENTEFYAIGGVNAKFLINENALHVDPENVQNTIWTSNYELAPIVFSWHAGVGGAIKIGSFAGVLGEITYYKQMNNQYKELPVNKVYGLVGVKIGAYLKL